MIQIEIEFLSLGLSMVQSAECVQKLFVMTRFSGLFILSVPATYHGKNNTYSPGSSQIFLNFYQENLLGPLWSQVYCIFSCDQLTWNT